MRYSAGDLIPEQTGHNVLTKDISGYILPIFIVCAMTLSYMPKFSKITIFVGFIVSIGYLLYFLSGKNKIQPEVVIYLAWVLWCSTGAFVSFDQESFWTRYFTVFQVSVMIFVVAGITSARGSITTALIGIIIGITIILIELITSGDLTFTGITESKQRIAGMLRNANIFSYHMLFGIFAIFYFWRKRRRWWHSAFIYSVLIILSGAIIASGSRKMFLAEVLFFNLWFVYCYGKRIFRSSLGVMPLLIFIFSIYFFIDFTMTKTITGERLYAIPEEYERGYGLKKRQRMYEEGVRLINKNPVLGVGLNQYILIAEGVAGYSHSDFIEVTAGSGLVGALIYYSIFVVLWRRLNWIGNRIRNAAIVYNIGLMKATIALIFLLGLGIPYYYFKITWIYIAGVVGFTWFLEKKIKRIIHIKRMKQIAETRAKMRMKGSAPVFR